MSNLHPPVDLAKRDKAIVELGVPALMLVLMAEEAAKKGFVLRADALHKLNMASAAPLAKLDVFSIRRMAIRINDAATTLLRDLNPDDPREGLYCCAMFTLKLVDEGKLLDKNNMAVLVSLMLIDDVKDESLDDKGNGVVWRLDEVKWRRKASELLHRTTLMGLYDLTRDMQLTA